MPPRFSGRKWISWTRPHPSRSAATAWRRRLQNADRCAECGSPRIVSHPELHALSIAHVDCDAFYAAVEKRDNPSLADRPVIVGGGKRGVVSTACYVARTFGVRSAMPMFKALEACPHAVVIPPDMAKYVRVGREVRDLMLSLTPAVEPLSIDEAFLDLTGTERVHKATPALTLGAVSEARRGRDRRHRFYRAQPQQVSGEDRLGPRQAARLRRDRPGGDGCIPRRRCRCRSSGASARRCRSAWLTTDSTASPICRSWMRNHLARAVRQHRDKAGRLSRGEDVRTVVPEREAKGISAETTFDSDHRRLPTISFRSCENCRSASRRD